MRVGFIFGSPKISGGSYVIFQHAEYLMKLGHTVDLITLQPVTLGESDIWHDALRTVRFVEISATKGIEYDIVFATWWISPFHLHRVASRQYAYFVQSIEAYFYDDTKIASQYLAHASYGLGLPVITEALWIKEDLEKRFHSDVFFVENGIRKEIYRPTGPQFAPKSPGKIRFLIEGSVTSPFKNVARTVDALRASKADEIWLLTPNEISDYPHCDQVISNVPIHEVPKIYRSCDVLVKQSFVEGMFGPPLEMFHCGGTAIVSNVTGFEQYIENEVNALVTNIGNWYQITEAANRLYSDRGLLDRLREGARATADVWPDWPTQSAQFAKAVEQICALPPVNREELAVKAQHCLNQYSHICDALNSHYQPKEVPALSVSAAARSTIELTDGARAYYEQLQRPVLLATRFSKEPSVSREVWHPHTQKYTLAARNGLSSDARKFGTPKRIFCFSISNEHLEEIFHPVIDKAGWDALYMCTRPKGYFTLYNFERPEIPDDRYLVANWISAPDLLYEKIEDYDPDLILFHNGNHPTYQHILSQVKKRFRAPVAFSELGWFPQYGNIYFDPWGTNGASYLSAMSLEELVGRPMQLATLSERLRNEAVALILQLENDTNMLKFSPHFRSNRQLIENVLSSVPGELPIYIKPHPLDHNGHRYLEFANGRAILVDDPIPDLLGRVGSVIAINSTVLLEALDYPVNIYTCGMSILSNKGVAFEFDASNLSEIWQDKFSDNLQQRKALKDALLDYQVNLQTLSKIDKNIFTDNRSIRVLHDLFEGKASEESNAVTSVLAPASRSMGTVSQTREPGKRILVRSIRDCMVEMSKYKVISFDVFDTLLLRDLYLHQDVFTYNTPDIIRLVGDNKFDHKTARISAEKAARLSNPEGEVTMDAIYGQYLLATGLPADLVQKIQEMEVETEARLFKPRLAVLELFNYAKSISRKVVIISDFYINTDFVRQVLVCSGFDLSGVSLYVSCEHNLTKKDGALYDLVTSDLGVNPNEVLHVGDNYHVDMTNATKNGFDAIHIPSTRVALEIAPPLLQYLKLDDKTNLVGRRSVERSVLLGILQNGIFDDPFDVDLKTVFGNDFERFGYTVLGPLLVSFTTWLRKHARAKKLESILFLARDGWVLEQAFQAINEVESVKLDVKACYLPASRRMMDIIAYDVDFDNISRLATARYSTNPLREYLKVRFDIDPAEVSAPELSKAGFFSIEDLITLPQDKIRVLKLLQAISPKVIARSRHFRDLFNEYLAEIGIDTGSRIGVVDIGYFGSMQKTINRVIGSSENPIEGFYIATRREAKFDPELNGLTHGYLADGFEIGDGQASAFTSNLIFMEQIFSAPHASVVGLRRNGTVIEPDYLTSTGETKQWNNLKKIHSGALRFVRDYAALVARMGVEFDMDKLDHSAHLGKLFADKHPEVAQLFKDFILENRYNGDGIMALGSKFAEDVVKSPSPASKAPVPAPKAPAPDSHTRYQRFYNNGCIAFHKKDYETAVHHFCEAERLQSSNANLQRVLAETKLLLGRKSEALLHLKKGAELAPENKPIRRRIRQVKWPMLAVFLRGNPFPVPRGE